MNLGIMDLSTLCLYCISLYTLGVLDRYRPSFAASWLRIWMIDAGIGRTLKLSLRIILLVAIESILTDPVRLPVGKYTIQSSVRGFIELSVFATVH